MSSNSSALRIYVFLNSFSEKLLPSNSFANSLDGDFIPSR
nr:MAG TPA: hypothetical protein [Caudoviricetes sp.]